MIACPQCAAEVQPDWDWCHACGFDPEGAAEPTGPSAPLVPELAPPPPPPTHPVVLRSELVPLGETMPATREAAGGRRPSGSYVAHPARSAPILIAAVVGAILVVGVVVLFVGRGDAPVTRTADRTNATIAPTTALAVTTWTLPEGGFAVDLPVALAPDTPPPVPEPFVSATAYSGSVDGRSYLVASLVVHPAYRWEDTGRAFIDGLDALAATHGFAVASRTAGATLELPSNRFTVVAARTPTETEAEFRARTDGPATGEGVALIDGNHLYIVLVRSDSLARAQFEQILESIVVV